MKAGDTCRFCTLIFCGNNTSVRWVSIWARRDCVRNCFTSCPPCGRFQVSSWETETALSKPVGGEFKFTAFCLEQRRRSGRWSCCCWSRGWLGRSCWGRRRCWMPPVHHCGVLMALLSCLLVACEDGYKLENETCVRYGDCSALSYPTILLNPAFVTCWHNQATETPSCFLLSAAPLA